MSEIDIERVVTVPCPARQPVGPHDYRARAQADGTYRAVCEFCQDDGGPMDFSAIDTIYGVGYFRKQP